ncbi:shugoshin [Drosophila serrata]|uniref:shugoshin n=1 Tax=Drosophila serrata TaxID=7274 RepID=UPI000A1D1C80|nr:shugoshin [Drosophila serrata]
MASKVEQQYKLLNAELMDQVQKQRIEIGLYKKELIALKHENMELREARILQIARQRQDHIGIVKSLMRRLEIDAKSLTDINQSPEKESISSEASYVVNRQSQKRRSSREICLEMRQSSALASSSRTISPARRRSTISEEPNEAPRLKHTPPSRRVVEIANDRSDLVSSPKTISPTRRRAIIPEERRNEAPKLTHTPPPRRVAEIAIDSSSEDEVDVDNTSTAQDEQKPIEELPPRKSDDDLGTIIEDTDEETTVSSSSYSSSPISCDSTIEEFTLPRQVLRSLDQNVANGGMLTRGKGKPTKPLALNKDNSTEEQRSIQLPRLLVTGPSATLVDSLMSIPSFASDASKLSPRRSMFEGNFRLSGTNTSTPIPNRSSPQGNMTAKKTSEVSAKASRWQPNVRVRKLRSEPKEAEQTTDLSTTSFSSNERRPSRKCRPTQLSEPNLRTKMRNSSVGKKIN